MALLSIHFKLTILRRHPKEEINTVEFWRRLDDHEHRWDPLPQLGSTILIPFLDTGGNSPLLGTSTFNKTPCEVVNVSHELNGHLSYYHTRVFCEATFDILYMRETFGFSQIADFAAALKERDWYISSLE